MLLESKLLLLYLNIFIYYFSLIDFCETKKNEDRLITGPIGPNPFQEKKSCSLLWFNFFNLYYSTLLIW